MINTDFGENQRVLAQARAILSEQWNVRMDSGPGQIDAPPPYEACDPLPPPPRYTSTAHLSVESLNNNGCSISLPQAAEISSPSLNTGRTSIMKYRPGTWRLSLVTTEARVEDPARRRSFSRWWVDEAITAPARMVQRLGKRALQKKSLIALVQCVGAVTWAVVNMVEMSVLSPISFCCFNLVEEEQSRQMASEAGR